ncbi:MAG: 4'-phosphopantetheinyl transferase superfamily protein [Magnetococcus sp. DMHC-8]
MCVRRHLLFGGVVTGGESTSARDAAEGRTEPHQDTRGPASAWPPPLPDHAVHLWQRTLRPAPARVEALYTLLSTTERQRADRLHPDRDRPAFITVRGTLRTLLGHYLAQPPASLQLGCNGNGKPELTGHTPSLCFNVTHSGQWGLYAFSRTTPLGIDLEQIRPATPAYRLRLAHRFLAEAEYVALRQLPVEQIDAAFIACWTRKEAYIKCHGASIARLLARFVVNVDPAQPARLLATAWRPADVTRCQLHDLPAPPGYRAALALASTDRLALCHYHWPAEE